MKLGRLTILAVCIVGFGAIASAQDGYHYSNWAYNVRPDQPLAPVLAHTIFTTNAYSMRARWVNASAWSQWVGNPAGSQFQARLRCYTNTAHTGPYVTFSVPWQHHRVGDFEELSVSCDGIYQYGHRPAAQVRSTYHAVFQYPN